MICLQINVLPHYVMGIMVLAEGSSLPHTSTNAPHENGDTRPAFSSLIWLISAVDLAI